MSSSKVSTHQKIQEGFQLVVIPYAIILAIGVLSFPFFYCDVVPYYGAPKGWEELSALLTLIVISVTAYTALRQLNEQRKYSKSLAHTEISNQLIGVNRLLIENTRAFDAFQNLEKNYPESALIATEDLQDCRPMLVDQILTLFESVYLQYRKYDFLDEEEWKPWERVIDEIFCKPYVSGYWERKNLDEVYEREFSDFIKRKLEQKQPKPER